MDGDEVYTPIPIAHLIQGEKEQTNLQHDLEIKSDKTNKSENKKCTENCPKSDKPISVSEPANTISQDQNQLDPSEQVRNKPVNTRSQRTCIPTRYIREIQSGIGTTDGRPRKTDLPTGIQVPAPIAEIKGENEDEGQLEHAMAAAISEIKVINPQSLEEVMRRPDWPKWEVVIQEELTTLKRVKTWRIVERPRERNIVKNK